MLLQTPLKFWQMCKNSLAKISGTPQFFIRHVNNGGGRWNCLCTPTSRLTGRQGRCAHITTSHQCIKLRSYHILFILHPCWCRHLCQSPGLRSPAFLPWTYLLVSPCYSYNPAKGIIMNIIVDIIIILLCLGVTPILLQLLFRICIR